MPMLLVIPYNPKHLPLYKHILALKGGARHDVLLAGPHTQVYEMEEALNILKGAFSHADIFTGDDEYTSPNKLFADTVKWLDSVGNDEPFYWFADSVPVKSSWLADIAEEYGTKQMPYLGATQTVPGWNPGTRKWEEEPPRLLAASVYPPDLWHRSLLIRQLSYRVGGEPWHSLMRFEMRPEATQSEFIQHGGKVPVTSKIAVYANVDVIEELEWMSKPAKKEKDNARK
jgi:hypothetical protein